MPSEPVGVRYRRAVREELLKRVEIHRRGEQSSSLRFGWIKSHHWNQAPKIKEIAHVLREKSRRSPNSISSQGFRAPPAPRYAIRS